MGEGIMLTHRTSRLTDAVGYPTSARPPFRAATRQARLINFGANIKTFLPNAPIFDEGERTDYVYRLTRGTVQATRCLATDGVR